MPTSTYIKTNSDAKNLGSVLIGSHAMNVEPPNEMNIYVFKDI